MNDKHLDIIIIAAMFGIMLAIYAGYKLVYCPSVEIRRTVITLPEPEHKELTAVDATVGGKI